MINRRYFLQSSLALGATGVTAFTPQKAAAQAAPTLTNLALVSGTAATQVPVPLPTSNGRATAIRTTPTLLSGATHPKFVNPLPHGLAAINVFTPTALGATANDYVLRLREFTTQLGLVNRSGVRLNTVVWGYGTALQAPTSPGRAFNVRSGSVINVTYVNELMNPVAPVAGATATAIPHRLPVDTTVAWANPGNLGGLAPVPLVAHRHGGLQDTGADGLPDAWDTPDTNNDGQPDFKGRLWSRPYPYLNNQEAGHLWYHDHAMGVTRLNVNMGLAGQYFIRDANEDLLVASNNIPSGVYELPLAIQDKMFDANGNIFFPSVDPANPAAPIPTHLPEFFGDFMLVNGVPWPTHNVEPRSYRLRLLNACDSRFLNLSFLRANGAAITFHQIGTELGMMNAPAAMTSLLIAPGERADIVVSFKGLARQGIRMVNTAATPFPNGLPVDPATGGQIMLFRTVLSMNAAVPDTILPLLLRPLLGPLPLPVPGAARTRKLLLVEGLDPHGRLQTLLGTVNPAAGNPATPAHGTFFFNDPVTENIARNTTEIWEFHNTTVDAHPIHVHLVDFRVLNRQAFTGTVVPKPMGPGGTTTGGWLTNVRLKGAARPAGAHEAGRKDTVVCYPGEITRILVSFPNAGEYVWHCHILSHEDHEMMRPIIVK